jgi:uncharacterized protein
VLKALRTCNVCASMETLDELTEVLDREKFDRYLDRDSRSAFVALIRRAVQVFAVQELDIGVLDPPCRDSRDNQFPALALVSEADALVSSDEDLLVLHPWRGMPIITPAEFLGG